MSQSVGAQEDCDVELDALNFGEVCADDEGANCLEEDLEVDLSTLGLPLDVFELANVDVVGDADVFTVDASLDDSVLSVAASFCPTITGDFEATAIITVEDPILGIQATVCLGLFGTGLDCDGNDCDAELNALNFGEVCVDDTGGNCLEESLEADLSTLGLPLDVFELVNIDVVGDADVFTVDASLDDSVLSVSASFCPVITGDFEATARITVEDPVLGAQATVCLGLFGTGIDCPDEGPVFDVTVDSTNDPVDPGEPLEVNATIENTGTEEGTQEVTLELDGTVQDTAEVTLAPDESETVTLTADTAGLDPGEYTATVSSENGSDQVTVTIGDEQAGPAFDVTIEGTNSPVEPGDPLEVDALIENTTDEELTQTISLELDGEVQDTAEVTLGPGESESITLTADTSGLDPGEYTAIVSSEDGSDQTTVTIGDEQAGPAFDVTIEGTNAPVEPGDPLEVDALIENTTDEELTQTVSLELDGEVQDTAEVTLGPGESESITLTADTSGLDPGEYTAIVSSEDGSDQTTVTIGDEQTGPAFEVSIGDINTPIQPGEPIEVDATIENTTDEELTQTISLELDGEVLDTVEVTLGPGESETITLTGDTTGLDPGEYTVTVSSEDDSAQETITIGDGSGEQPTVTVSIGETNSPVEPGEPLEVVSTVENTGDTETTQEITLSLNGSPVDETTVTLGPGESDTATLTASTDSLEPGTYLVTVASAGDSAQAIVTVAEEPGEPGDGGDGGDSESNQTVIQGNSNSQVAESTDGNITQSQAVSQSNEANVSGSTAASDIDFDSLFEDTTDD
ncbi:CARDB domain-containing protein [Natrialba sp. PRR66]|uniref:CARDB domain-containing protein n=1 Tax=Natrialba sp. PRR66 TaxID=3098146 RepID=UPI002B1CE358|nr:CARDB domain-containing protein [Natrialba sp. PRR66]